MTKKVDKFESIHRILPPPPNPPTEEELRCKKCGNHWGPEHHYGIWYYNNYQIYCRQKRIKV